MNKHMNNKVKDLLLKFHSNEISSEEFKELADKVDCITDKELCAMLHEHWDEYEDYDALPLEKMDALYLHLQKKTRTPLIIRIKRHWLQIAASVLLLIASGTTAMFYVQHHEIRKLTEQNVVIRSGESGPSSVLLPDGTKVRLNTRSSLTYQQDFGHKDRKVTLSGEGYFEVKHDEEKQFIVHTGFMNVAVLGTTFNVYAYENKDFLEMSLIEGAVRVTGTYPPYKVIEVKPNEKVTYDKRTGKLKLERTSNRIETAWLQKKMVFRHDKLQDVLSTLERKFGVTFVTDNDKLLQDVYTGVFDDESIDSILRILQLHYGFTYKMKDTEIIIETKE